MQLIFLNSLEVKTEENRVRQAQVSISEHQGMWRVLWTEPGEGDREQQICWYEGPHWQEMLSAYRAGLLEKRGAGFMPLIDTGSEQTGPFRNKEAMLLQYYGEKNFHDGLFLKLRQWRREQAGKEGKSAFFIATNRMLYMIAAFIPHTAEELRMLPGFGKRKAELYGGDIVAITKGFEQPQAFPLDWVAGMVKEHEFEAWMDELNRTRAKQEWERIELRKRLLGAIGEGMNLSGLEEQLGLKRYEAVRMVEELDKEGYDVSALVDLELSAVSGEEAARVQELFRMVGDRFLKPVLKGLYKDEELSEQNLNDVYEKLRLHRLKFRALQAAQSEQESKAV